MNPIDLLADALPYVEDAAEDDAYSDSGKQRIRKLARDMRETIEQEAHQ